MPRPLPLLSRESRSLDFFSTIIHCAPLCQTDGCAASKIFFFLSLPFSCILFNEAYFRQLKKNKNENRAFMFFVPVKLLSETVKMKSQEVDIKTQF